MKSVLKPAAWWLLLVCCAPAISASAQEKLQEEERLDIITDSRLPLPMHLQGGARWLLNALRASQAKSPTTQEQPDVTAEVRELEGVHQRVGSVEAGTFLDGAISPSERQQIWKQLAQEWRTAEASRVRPAANEAGPFHLLETYSEQIDPSQAAIVQLRVSARNLDQAAADLEDAGNYAAADRLRASASRLRREAREFASEQE